MLMYFRNKYRKKILPYIHKYSKTKHLKNYAIISSFFGEKLDSNCIAIANKLIGLIPVIFVYNNIEIMGLDPRVRVIKYNSIKHFYWLHRSKFIINNVRYKDNLFKKLGGQIYIQLWHGIPYKRLAFDQPKISWENTTKQRYLGNFLLEVDKWDYLCAQNDYTKNKFKSCFYYDKKFIVADYPSDKRIVEINNNIIKNQLRENLSLPIDSKVVLYAPTFREYQHTNESGYKNTLTLPKEFFEKHPEVVFLIRTHYLIKDLFKYSDIDNIRDVSSYPNIEELYSISDIMISDYSSVIFEYARTSKPIILYQVDYQEYNEKRGLYNIDLEGLGIERINNWKEISFDSLQNTKICGQFSYIKKDLDSEVLNVIKNEL